MLPAGLAVGVSAARALTHRIALSALLGWGYPLWSVLLAAAGLAVAAGVRSELRAALRGGPGRGWFPARAAFVSCVVGAVVFLALFPVFDQVWLDLSGGLVGGLFAALLLLTRASGRGLRAVDFVLFHLCLALFLAELGLRAAGRVTANPLLAQPGTGPWQFVMQQMLPPNKLWWGFRTNSEGHYDDEFTAPEGGQRTVATIGDSFSVGAVHHSLHFTTVAERASGVRVDNYGAPGIGPLEYLEMLSLWVAPRRPDLVVINLFLGNDLLLERLATKRSLTRLQSWLDRANVLALQVPLRVLRLERSRTGVEPRRQPALLIESREQLLAALPWMADPSLEPETFEEDTFLSIEAARVTEIGIEADCEGLFALLRRMRAAAGDIPLAVMLIPDEFQVEDPLWDQLLERWPRLAGAERDRPQRLLAEFLASEGIPSLDLLPLLRAVPPLPDGRRHLYHLHDTHFNARGNRIAGEALAEFLRTALGL